MHKAWGWIPRTTQFIIKGRLSELREYSQRQTDKTFRQTGNNVPPDPKLVEKGRKKEERETRNVCTYSWAW